MRKPSEGDKNSTTIVKLYAEFVIGHEYVDSGSEKVIPCLKQSILLRLDQSRKSSYFMSAKL